MANRKVRRGTSRDAACSPPIAEFTGHNGRPLSSADLVCPVCGKAKMPAARQFKRHRGERVDVLLGLGLDGVLGLRRALGDGREALIDLYLPEEIFDRRLDPDDELVALSPCRVIELSPHAFDEDVHGERDYSEEYVKHLGLRMRHLHARTADMILKTPIERLAALILRLSHLLRAEDPPRTFRLPIRYGDIASLIGVSPETASRALKRLSKERALSSSRKGEITINDRSLLEAIARGGRPRGSVCPRS